MPPRPPTENHDVLTVATDGSGNDEQVGFGWFAHDHLYGYGPGILDQNPELIALLRMLDVIPTTQPLHVLCDSHEVFLRLVDGVPPRPRNTHHDLWVQTMTAVAARPVTFAERLIKGHREHPLHAVAHYLAYLGRIGQTPTPGTPAPGAAQILTAPDPNAEAHAMVEDHLGLRRVSRAPLTPDH